MSVKIKVDWNKLLPLLAASIAALILLVTIIALIAGKRPGIAYRKSDPHSAEQIKGASQEQMQFKEFGTLRTRLLPDEGSKEAGSVLLVTPWLSYQNDDSAFYEELLSKKNMFASYILEFFSTKTKNALLSAGEKEIKRILLERLNSQLSLGKVDAIYFDDYIFLD
ncbi:MAG: hypothetical protein J6V90_02340 [Treponema sp.]|nr:hypothetical protein [Treponema sp.]